MYRAFSQFKTLFQLNVTPLHSDNLKQPEIKKTPTMAGVQLDYKKNARTP